MIVGDKWFLGEDIPDMDFFFSQIWLSCFVNEFLNPSGKAYKQILSIYKGYNLVFYYGEKDSFEVGKNIVDKFLKDPDFAVKVNEEIVHWADKLRQFAEGIPEDLSNKSNEELWKLYEKHDKVHTEYYQWGWIPVGADMFHNNFTAALKDHLKTLKLSEEKVNEYFLTLTQLTKKSLIQIEQEEFLELATLVNNDEHHKKLFKEKPDNFISQIKPEVLDKIKEYHEKYFYVSRMWVGNTTNLEHYCHELAKLIQEGKDPEEELKKIEKELKESIEKKEQLLKTLKLKKNWLTLYEAFADFMVTKIYRRYAQIYALYKMGFVQKEIAMHLDIDLKQMRFMLPVEVKNALLNKKIDKEELHERTEFCVYYAEKGKDVVYIGEEAKRIADVAQKVDHGDVKELKGQVACMGKAKGEVKIIIRPSDMDKMNEGDILVSIATDPDIVSAMKMAGAIVTEQGGVTSHAAIVSRELNIPCVIGTKIATKVLKDGDLVEVDANKGVIKVL